MSAYQNPLSPTTETNNSSVVITPTTPDQVVVLNQNTINAIKTTTLDATPSKLTFYGRGESGHLCSSSVSFKQLRDAGTVKLMTTGRNGISNLVNDSSEIFHVAFTVKYIDDTHVETSVQMIGYTEKANNFADRAGFAAYVLSTMVAEFKSPNSVQPAVTEPGLPA